MLQALFVVAIYWAMNTLNTYLGVGVLIKPMILATVVGAALGDLQTGILMGGALESVFMGVMVIGGSTPSDKILGSIIPTYCVVALGQDMETGIALAYPIGTLATQMNNLITPLWVLVEPQWKKMAAEGNSKKYCLCHNLWFIFLSIFAKLFVAFIYLWLGSQLIDVMLNFLPDFVMTGIKGAGNMMAAVGIGITLASIWNPELAGFFFIGWVLTQSVGLGSIQVAILGIACAVVYYFIDQRIINAAKTGSAEVDDRLETGGDLF